MNKRGSVISNFLWRFSERSGAEIVQFIVSIFLARILSTDDYGTVAIITVFTTILNVFVNCGLGSALIQKKDTDDLDFSTVFYANVLLCIVLYIILFFSAPIIANFYNQPTMTSLIRVMGLSLIISGVRNIQITIVSKRMIYKNFFYATIIGTVISAVIGILMALKGFGAWSLVFQGLINNFIGTVILWFVVKWKPILAFSFKRFKGLFSFGSRLLASSLLETLYNNLRTLIIGKLYSPSDLAYYNKARQWPALIVDNINTSIDSVLFPTMSEVQDEKDRLKSMTRRAIKTSTYIMAPLLLGLAAVSEPAVKLILTEKWLPMVPYMRIFCVTFIFYPIHTANLNAIKALGRSDIFLKLEIIKKIIGLIVLFATMWISVEAMAYSLLFTSFTSQIINSWPNKKLMNYGYIEQLRDILPSIILGFFMAVFVYSIQLLGLNIFLTIVLQIVSGAAFYILFSKIFNLEIFNYLLNLLLSFLRKKESR